MTQPQIIYQDDSLMIINKPAGWIVNQASTTGDTPVIQKWINDNFDFQTSMSNQFRSGIVHRIDKETSGVLVLAKTEQAFKDIQKQFKKRQIRKKYLALVHGKMVPEEGSVNAPVGRLPWNRERFGVIPGGRKAQTFYKLQRVYLRKGDNYSLVEFSPITGRTHQIRIHAKYLRHPIVSDTFYAGRKTSAQDRKWCPRMFLHAWKIRFFHPAEKNDVEFTAELHQDLKGCLDSLEIAGESK